MVRKKPWISKRRSSTILKPIVMLAWALHEYSTHIYTYLFSQGGICCCWSYLTKVELTEILFQIRQVVSIYLHITAPLIKLLAVLNHTRLIKVGGTSIRFWSTQRGPTLHPKGLSQSVDSTTYLWRNAVSSCCRQGFVQQPINSASIFPCTSHSFPAQWHPQEGQNVRQQSVHWNYPWTCWIN